VVLRPGGQARGGTMVLSVARRMLDNAAWTIPFAEAVMDAKSMREYLETLCDELDKGKPLRQLGWVRKMALPAAFGLASACRWGSRVRHALDPGRRRDLRRRHRQRRRRQEGLRRRPTVRRPPSASP